MVKILIVGSSVDRDSFITKLRIETANRQTGDNLAQAGLAPYKMYLNKEPIQVWNVTNSSEKDLKNYFNNSDAVVMIGQAQIYTISAELEAKNPPKLFSYDVANAITPKDFMSQVISELPKNSPTLPGIRMYNQPYNQPPSRHDDEIELKTFNVSYTT